MLASRHQKVQSRLHTWDTAERWSLQHLVFLWTQHPAPERREQKSSHPSSSMFFSLSGSLWSGLGGEGSGGNPAIPVTSAIIHIRWRVALTEFLLVFTPNGRNGLAVHVCRRIFYARGNVLHTEADKTCLVQGHHCEHARTREEEGSAVQQRYCLALNMGAEEKWIRSSLKRALQGQLQRLAQWLASMYSHFFTFSRCRLNFIWIPLPPLCAWILTETFI